MLAQGSRGLDRFSRCDAVAYLVKGLVNLVEAFNSEKEFVHLVDVNWGVQDGIEGKIADLAVALEDVGAFAVGADQAAAVDFDTAVLADQAQSWP